MNLLKEMKSVAACFAIATCSWASIRCENQKNIDAENKNKIPTPIADLRGNNVLTNVAITPADSISYTP